MKTKLFYVVESARHNAELYETREEAIEADNANRLAGDNNCTITISEVKDTYKDGDRWNYEDRAETFNNIIKI